MKQTTNRRQATHLRCMNWKLPALALLLLLPLAGQMLGCEVDSFFDPSKTGRFMHTPTTIPILDRIDVIEHEEELWGQVTGVMPEDLMPSDLRYVLAPGDFITVEIFELYAERQWHISARRIDAEGRFRLPELGDLVAAGKTVQEFEDEIIDRYAAFVAQPLVNVILEEGRAFTYTIYGFLANSGMFTLRDPDLRLLDALAIVGGVPLTVERIYIIREVPLTEDVRPIYDRERAPDRAPTEPPRRDERPVDVDDLIEQLRDRPGAEPGMMAARDEGERDRLGTSGTGGSMNQARLVDVDDLAPVRVAPEPPVDLDEIRERAARDRMPTTDDTFIYVEELGEWVRARTQPRERVPGDDEFVEEPRLILERIIEIPYQRLARGDSSYNVVIRPNDRIYIEGPTPGLVYISGEIARPGVYDLPQVGRITLSRLVAAAGDPGPVAIPERVDLTRIVGPGREATVRVNLAAIRRRTEPDLYLKPNDHVIIGTSWVATPLAVIRNGFRATYGFGFLLDRNFGNDVFGAPPGSRFAQ